MSWFRRPKAEHNQSVWKRGEKEAARYLKRHGLRILETNLRLPVGEIDLLCFDKASNAIVIIEVKARQHRQNSRVKIDPTANIDAAKQRKLRQLARTIKKDPQYSQLAIRIDAVGVIFADHQRTPIEIKHYINAVHG